MPTHDIAPDSKKSLMYYSSGNYEAFARPRKPEGAEKKTACFVGSGLASLAGAAVLIRDGQMQGNQITILEQQKLPGGALDGIKDPEKGFVIQNLSAPVHPPNPGYAGLLDAEVH